MTMTHESFTASDGYRWAYRRFHAPGPRGRVGGLHGIQSHGGWYETSCAALASAGWEATFLDRRGSGRNETARGDAPSFRRLLVDLAEFLEAERRLGRPVILLAISWGGKLAVALQRYRPGLT